MAVVLSGASYVARGQTPQSTGAQTLRLAQSIYEQGRLHELEPLLNTALSEGRFNDAEKVNAYKLLTLTYIYLEQPEKADQTMLLLLRIDTEFYPNEVDPAEFWALYKTFRTNPVYRIGGKLGGTVSRPSILTADYVNDGTNKISNNYGFAATVSTEIPLLGKMKKFTLNPELSFQMTSFKGENNRGDNTLADTSLVTPATETQAWISLPVSIQYGLFTGRQDEKKYIQRSYYVSAGLTADYLLSAKKKIISNREGNSAIDENSFDVTEQRNRFNAGAIVSAGFKRKIGKGYLVVELRYRMGLLAISKKADTYENSVLTFDYKYADGIYKLNTLSLSAGYLMNRYNPKKLTSR